MPICFRITRHDASIPGQLTIGLTNSSGAKKLADVLALTFPGLQVTRKASGVHLGWLDLEETFQLSGTIPSTLEAFLGQSQALLWAVDNCDLSTCLDFYQLPAPAESGSEEWSNTAVGGLIFFAKYRYRQPGATDASLDVASRLAEVVKGHPSYATASRVAAVPPSSNHGNRPDLARGWAKAISDKHGIPLISLKRTREVPSQKDFVGTAARRTNQLGSMICDEEVVGEKVLLVDDLYTSGETINEACRALKQAGALGVMSLCAVKTATGTQGYSF